MAITITKIDVATPTTLAAVAAAGGALADDTYYYRIASYRKYPTNTDNVDFFCYSAWSAEVNAATSGANNTVALTWDAMANATGYILQRSLVSGDYGSLEDENTLRFSTRWGTHLVGGITTNSLNDNGGAVGAGPQWDGNNIDLDNEWPMLYIQGASTADTVTLSDILTEDVAQSWDLITILGKSQVAATLEAAIRKNAFYFSKAGLYFEDCTFQIYGPLYIFGSFWMKDSILTAVPSLKSRPKIFYTTHYGIDESDDGLVRAADNNTTTGLDLDANSVMTDLMFERVSFGSVVCAYERDIYGRAGSSANGVWTRCAMAHGTQSSRRLGGGTVKNCVFSDIEAGGIPELADVYCYQSVNSINSIDTVSNTIFRRVWFESTYDPGKSDITMSGSGGKGAVLIDCTFHSNEDGTYGTYDKYEAVMHIIRVKLAVHYPYHHAYSFALKVVDSTGAAISGATIAMVDAANNGAIWVASDATTTDTLNDTDSSSTLTVNDGTKFSENDVIRHENCDEIYLVTAISTNDLTITRGHLGTTKRQLAYSTGVGARRILTQTATLTTDANGDITSEPIFGRSYEHNHLAGRFQRNTESGHVTAGTLLLTNHTPHTVTISATGYNARVIKYNFNRPINEVEKLTADSTNLQDVTLYDSTIY